MSFLGRARYQRRTDEHRAGVRNGWQPPTAVKTTTGPVDLQSVARINLVKSVHST
jgi:hypothetical protein